MGSLKAFIYGCQYCGRPVRGFDAVFGMTHKECKKLFKLQMQREEQERNTALRNLWYAGLISPDGHWRWDGRAWQPTDK